MKRVLAVALLALFATAATASAGDYIPPLKAKHIAREEAEAHCGTGCSRFEWSCRTNRSGSTCVLDTFFEKPKGVLECKSSLHLTIGAGGDIRRHYGGKPHCSYLK